MKICALDLIAFGPFTDRRLEFGTGPAGMSIVLGSNEAGKSSALRAMRGALYGIAPQTDDNFLHKNQKLRIGIELLDHNGDVTTFVRRKGNKDTLLSSSGEAIDESALKDIYHGIPESLFSTLFGITHRDLSEGGEDILSQQGELGQALFSASTARKNLHQILKNLDESANNLFTPRGQKQAINKGLKDYAELKKKLTELSLNSDDWASLQDSFEKTAERVDELSSEIKANNRKLNELQRNERLLPKIAAKLQLQSQIRELGYVKQLDGSFADRRQTAVSALVSAKSVEHSLISRRDDLIEQMQGVADDNNLLALETTIQSLYQSLESYTRACKQLPVLQQNKQLVESDLNALLQTIQPGLAVENIDILIPVLSREGDIKSAVSRFQSLQLETKQYFAAATTCEQKLKSLEQEKVEPVDDVLLRRLRHELQYAQQHSQLDSDLRDHKVIIATMEGKINSAIAALPYWSGSIEQLQALPVPGKQTIQEFDKQLGECAQELTRLSSDLKRLDSELQLLREKIEGLRSGADLPSKQELEEIRNSRNNAWSLLKNQWMDGVDVTLEAGFLDAQRKLPEAFEWRLYKADEIADRLRSDSDRVAQLESLGTDSKRITAQKQNLLPQLKTMQTQKNLVSEKWAAEWETCGITPHSPDEMLEWRNTRDEILRLAEDLGVHRSKVASLELTRKELFHRILSEPCPIKVDDSNSLNHVLSEVAIWIETTEKTAQSHAQFIHTTQRVEEELLDANNKLAVANKSMKQWQADWLTLINGTGLASTSEPNNAIERLQLIRDAFAKSKQLREVISASENFEREIQDFNALHDELGIDAGVLSRQQHVPELYRQLSLQKQAEAVRQKNKEEFAKVTIELNESQRQHESSVLLMNSLLAEAACSAESELPDLERRSAELTGLKQQLAVMQREILQDGGGKTINEIETALHELDAASLSAEIKEIRQRIDTELEPLKQELSEERGSKRKQLESMYGSGEVALVAEQAEISLTRIRKHIESYMQLKTAAKLLRDEIERFRKHNQGPLLKIAGAYFSELTLGGFVGLGSDFNEQDKIILTAERSTGEKVSVEGMSSGTRDQLYLALRLAAFERSIEQRGPMPFIVDDILIEFDDNRSQAALEVLSRLARKTQVVLFSHHLRIGELSKLLADQPNIITL